MNKLLERTEKTAAAFEEFSMPQQSCIIPDFVHPQSYVANKASYLNDYLKALLEKRFIKTDQFGFKIAKFQLQDFSVSFEPLLREIGVDYIQIELGGISNQTLQDSKHKNFIRLSSLTEDKGYFFRPAQISWNMGTVSWDEHLKKLDGKNRRRITSKLRKSQDVDVKIERITSKNLTQWLEVYDAEIAGRERGIAHISKDFLKKENLEDYRLISYRNNQGEFLGGAVVFYSKSDLSAIIGYAAYKSDSKQYELPTRTFFETLKLAQEESFPRVSHGWEDNMYGHHLTSGLMEFKAGLGLLPQASDEIVVTKVLKLDNFDTSIGENCREVIFYSGTNSLNLECKYISEDHKRIHTPSEINLSCIGVSSYQPKDNFLFASSSRIFQLLCNVTENENFLKIVNLLGISDYFLKNRLEASKNQTTPLFEALSHGHQKNNLRPVDVYDAVTANKYISEIPTRTLDKKHAKLISDNDFAGKLASYISEKIAPVIFEKIIPELVDKVFGDFSCLGNASAKNHNQYLMAVINQARQLYSKNQFTYFIAELNNVFNLETFLEDYHYLNQEEYYPLKSRLTLDAVYDENLFTEENKQNAGKLLEELYKNLILNNGNPFKTNWVYSYISETVNDETICYIKDLLEGIVIDKEGFFEEIDFRKLADGSPYILSAAEILKELSDLLDYKGWNERACSTSIYDDLIAEIKHDTGSDVKAYESLAYACGKDHKAIRITGRRTNEILAEIFDGLSKEDLTLVCNYICEDHDSRFGTNKTKIVKEEIELIDFTQIENSAVLNKDYLDKIRLINDFISLSKDSKEAYKFLHEKLNIEIKESSDKLGFYASEKIILNLVEVSGPVHDVNFENLRKWALEFANKYRDPDLIVKYKIKYPEFKIDKAELEYLKKNYYVANSDYKHSWYHCGFAILMMQSPETRDYGIKLFRRIKSFHFHPNSSDFSGIGTVLPLKKIIDTSNFDYKTKRKIEYEVIKMLKRSYSEPGGSDMMIFSGYLLSYLKIKGFKYNEFYRKLFNYEGKDTINLLSNIMHKNFVGKKIYTEFRKTFIEAINSGIDKWYYLAPSFSRNLLHFHWDKDFGGSLNEIKLSWMRTRAEEKLSNDTEIKEFLTYYWNDAITQGLNSSHFVSLILIKNINDENLKNEVLDVIRNCLMQAENKTFDSLYSWIGAANDFIYNDQTELLDKLIMNKDFLANYDWTKIGYSSEINKRVHQYAVQQECSHLIVSDLVSLLFCKGAFSQYWVSNLISNLHVSSFTNLIPILEYYRSMENFDDFIEDRISDLLQNKRRAIAKQLTAGIKDKLITSIEENDSADESLQKALNARLSRINQYENLFLQYSSERDHSQRREIKYAINHLILEDYPPKLVPEKEISNLVKFNYGAFYQRISEHELYSNKIRDFIDLNFKYLVSSRILDRLAQFSNFADEQGMTTMMVLLNKLVDAEQAGLYEMNLPHRGNLNKKYLQINSQFDDLHTRLLNLKIEPESVGNFMEGWSSSVVVREEDSNDNTYLFATSDIESWIKHGEEPKKTCHSLSKKAGDMDENDWNYQFGSCANTNGRPLARILLPQLKLLQFIDEGKIVARTVTEVTVNNSSEQKKLHLLVEVIYGSEKFYKQASFKSLIFKYAKTLGIEEVEITFADANPDSYPAPLEEEFRIYRDTFRPDNLK